MSPDLLAALIGLTVLVVCWLACLVLGGALLLTAVLRVAVQTARTWRRRNQS